MIGRRWDASFSNEHLTVRRRRLLPWSKADVRWIPLAAVLDIRSRSAAEHAKRRAQVTVQNQAAPYVVEVYHVRFTPEEWLRAGALMRDGAAAPTAQPHPGRALSPGAVPPSRPAIDVPAQPPRRAQPKITVSQQPDPSPERAALRPKPAPSSDGAVVSLNASDLAGRQIPKALQQPAGMNPDGSVRTVSGGLPTLGKRHR